MPYFETDQCQRYQFKCRTSNDCIAIYNVCDGIVQCKDGSDEADDLHCPDSNQNNYQLPSSVSSSHLNSPIINHHPAYSSSSSVITNQAYTYPKSSDSEFSKQNEPKDLNKFSNFVHGSNYQVQSQLYPNYPPPNFEFRQPLNEFYKHTQSSPSLYQTDNELLNGYGQGGLYFQADNQPTNYDFNQLFKIVKSFQESNLLPFSQKSLTQSTGINGNNDNSLHPSGSSSSKSQNVNYNSEMNQKLNNSPVNSLPTQIVNSSPQASIIQSSPLITMPQNNQHSESQSSIKAYTNQLMSNIQTSELKYPIAISHLDDTDISTGRDTNSAVIALVLGICITVALILTVGCRMRYIKRRICRRGRNLANDANYLVNGMYL